MAANTDLFSKAYQNFSTTIGAGGVTSGVATTIPLTSTTNLPTDTAVIATINRIDGSGNVTNNSETVIGVVSGTNLITCTRGLEGTPAGWGSGIVVEILLTASHWDRLISGILTEHNQDGTHQSITYPQIATPGNPVSGRDKLYFKNDDRLYKLSNSGIEKQMLSSTFSGSFANFIKSGLIPPVSGTLSTTITAGVIYYNGNEYSINSDGGHAYVASNDCYVDVNPVTGTYTYNTVVNNASAPALTASCLRIAKVVTNGTTVTTVTQTGVDSNGVSIYTSTPSSFTLGNNSVITTNIADANITSRKMKLDQLQSVTSTTNLNTATTSYIDYTGLTVTFTPNVASNYLVLFTCNHFLGYAHTSVSFAVLLDGVIIGNDPFCTNQVGADGNIDQTVSGFAWATGLTSAPHTIKVQAKTTIFAGTSTFLTTHYAALTVIPFAS